MPGADKRLSHVAFTRTVLGVLLGVIVLAVDTLNPVKLFLHVFPAVEPWHIALVCTVLSTYIWISEFKELLYFIVKVFLNSILSIFFRDIEVIGRDRLPRHGPMIFSINHANQFVDAAVVLGTCGSDIKVSYMMAEASWNRRIIGDLAKALDVVPVKRAQDDAIKGIGKVSFSKTDDFETTKKLKVTGYDSSFVSNLTKGDKIRPVGTATGVKVVEIIDDSTVIVEAVTVSDEDMSNVFIESEPLPYDVLKHVDLHVVFERVLDRLAAGGVVGIFPEGGSHDRTDLLPLKVGVALIAYSAMERDGLNVPIIPVGLNYFRTHRWRGKAIVEYGDPVYIDPSTLKDYVAGGERKRVVCNDLLERIRDSMRSVIVSMPDYESLQIVHTARRLYQRSGVQGKEKQDLLRRFAAGYKILMLTGDPPAEWVDLQDRIAAYRRELRDLGIRDYQVPALDREMALADKEESEEIITEIRIGYRIVHLLVLLLLSAIPNIFLNLPVRLLADIYAERRRQKALKKSKVKIYGYDVMLTEKLVFCIVAVPTLWIIYGFLLYFFTDFDGPTMTLCFMCFPSFAYMGIIASEAGMVDAKDLRPYIMRLYPSTRKRLKALPAQRRQLQKDLRAMIKKVGPAFGELYYGKELNWAEIQELSRKNSDAIYKVASSGNFPTSVAPAGDSLDKKDL
ncbi:acyltransferase [Nitzschia inconspicua]|uniref:Acyltransferase n=1 Tax=Nitzschia inconspicua TaxID=303405 RepID=A0A9K3PUL1_9STRA|nr:acyltransferase [Nitzschia inconspicua]